MSIYLGGNKLQLNLGGTSIRESYLGGVKVLGEVPLPALAANTRHNTLYLQRLREEMVTKLQTTRLSVGGMPKGHV